MSQEAAPKLNTGVELLQLPEWVKLLRHFELGEGFAFIILLVSNRALSRRCQTEMDLWLRARHRPSLFVLPLKTPDDLSEMPEQLLALAPPEGPIWIDGTGDRQIYEQAWNRCAMKLNRARDAIAARFSTPLTLVGAPYIREILRDAAPDFWSVRAFTAEISAATRVPLLSRPASHENVSEFHLDPALALRAIGDLRGKPGRERQLSKLLNRAGTQLFLQGRSQEALPLLREAIELDEAAVNSNTAHADYLRNLSISYDNMGDLLRELGEADSALQFYQKSLRIRERLVIQDPGRADYLQSLGVSYDRIGNLQSELGEGKEALQSHQKALQIAQRLVAQDPSRGDHLHNLSVSYRNMGDLQFALGEADAACQFYEKSLQIDERLVAEEPRRADFLRNLSVAYERMGVMQTALGEEEAARQFHEKSLHISERLVAAQPTRADYLLDVVRSLLRLGDAQHIQRAVEILRELKQTNRLHKSDEPLLETAQQRLQQASETSSP